MKVRRLLSRLLSAPRKAKKRLFTVTREGRFISGAEGEGFEPPGLSASCFQVRRGGFAPVRGRSRMSRIPICMAKRCP
jgi:hypothetical protein